MNKTRKCVGKEGFQRMNYLYQAINMMATKSRSANVASALYSSLLISISKKTVQRIDIDMKRAICKRCRSYLLAGITARVRLKKKTVIWTCLHCKNKKVFNVKDPKYLPWTKQDESVVEVLDYTPKEKTDNK